MHGTYYFAIEAVDIYTRLCSEGKQPLYYGGGTEIISMARTHNIYTDAVIDIKGIPECSHWKMGIEDIVRFL